MNCPVCKRKYNADLSICPSCGAMINDSVREDLIGKVSARLKPINQQTREYVKTEENFLPVKAASDTPLTTAAPLAVSGKLETATANIVVQPTNPTLVEFHTKNAAVPEWRLQLQNAVRQRQGQSKTDLSSISESVSPMPRAKLVTSGANALKAEVIQTPAAAVQKHPDLARALDRIEKSRQRFLIEEPTEIAPPAAKHGKNYPFYIAAKTNEADIKSAEVNSLVASFAKPKLASPPKIEAKRLDTNKLPPLAVHVADSFAVSSVTAEKNAVTIIGKPSIQTNHNEDANEIAAIEEYDDCPTFAMRFNAGLFDLIIGTFVSLCLLAPFILMGGTWLSGAGFLALVATVAIVMFIYLTTAIGFYGRTFGMRLFSLELIDIEGEEYPSFHQAAVSSSVYLLSLAFGGLGFLTVFFNEEKRAAHDLVSKTIVVKE